MKTSLLVAIMSVATSMVSAGIVITPITEDQVVEKMAGDCPFGLVTPQGCGYVTELALGPISIWEGRGTWALSLY